MASWGTIYSGDANFATALAGTGSLLQVNDYSTGVFIQKFTSNTPPYLISQTFLAFDTSYMPQPDELFLDVQDDTTTSNKGYSVIACLYDFGATLDASDWRTPAQLSTLIGTGKSVLDHLIVNRENGREVLSFDMVHLLNNFTWGGILKLVLTTDAIVNSQDIPDQTTQGYNCELELTAHFHAGNYGLTPGDWDSEVASDTPRLWWKLNESSGPTAADSSGNSSDGTYQSDPTFSQPPLLRSNTDTSVAFLNTENSYVVGNEDLSSNDYTTTGATLECIVNCPDMSDRIDYFPYVLFGPDVYIGPTVEIVDGHTNGNWIGTYNNLDNAIDVWGFINNNSIAHVVTVFPSDGIRNNIKMYIDGDCWQPIWPNDSSESPYTVNLNLNTFLSPTYFYGGGDGYDPGGSPPYADGQTDAMTGTLDEAIFYEYDLSSSRVQAHWAAIHNYKAEVLADGPVFYWRLGERDPRQDDPLVAADDTRNGNTGTYSDIEMHASSGLLYRTAADGNYSTAILADTPTVYYRLNENSPNQFDVWADSSGNGHDAFTGNASPALSVQQAGFSGDGDTSVFIDTNYIQSNDSFAGPYAEWTLEMIVQPSNIPASDAIIFGNVNDPGIWWNTNGDIYARFTDASIQTYFSGSSSAVPYDNTAIHVAATYDTSGNFNLYINGIVREHQIIGGAPAAVPNGSGPLYLSSPSNYAQGLDETAFYDYALTADQIKAHVASLGLHQGAGLLVNEEDGGVAVSDQKNVATPNDATYLAGTLTAWTIECLANVKAFPAFATQIYGSEPSYPVFRLLSDGTLSLSMIDPSDIFYPTPLTLNTTYHLVATYDGSETIFYVNSAEVGRTADTSTYNTNAPWQVGYDAGDNGFVAIVDEATFYDYALSPHRIEVHYNASLWQSDAPVGSASLADTVGITDTVAVHSVRNRALTDTVGITDSFDFELIGEHHTNLHVADTVGITDTVGISIHSTGLLADTVGITDSVYGTLSNNHKYASAVLADSPYLYWKLYESSGPTAADSTGHGHDGTYLEFGGETYGVPGLTTDTGTAVDFHDPPFSGNIISRHLFNATYATFAFEFLVYVPSGANTIGFGENFAEFQNGGGIFGTYDTGHVTLYGVWCYDTVNVLATSSVATFSYDTQHHIIMTYDGTNVHFYVDGTDVFNEAQPAGIHNTGVNSGSMSIHDTASNVLTLDEFAFYPASLTSTRVSAHYAAVSGSGYSAAVLADSPEVYYRFNDAYGSSTIADSSGNNYLADVNGGPNPGQGIELQQPGFTGDGDHAVSWPNYNDPGVYNMLPNQTVFGALSVECIIKSDVVPTNFYRALIGWDYDLYVQMYQYHTGSQRQIWWDVQTNYLHSEFREVKANVTNNGNDIYHLVGTWDGAVSRLYVNGDLVDTSSAMTQGGLVRTGNQVSTADHPRDAFYAAADSFTGAAFNGVMNHAALYDHALTADQVTTHYFARLGTGGARAGFTDTVGITDLFSAVWTRPTVTNVTPTVGSLGDMLTVTGTRLNRVTQIKFGTTNASFSLINSTTIHVFVSTAPSSPTTIFFYDSSGVATSFSSFTYVRATATSILPVSGQVGRRTPLTLHGTLLNTVTGVEIGGALCTDFVIVNSTTITCTTPGVANPETFPVILLDSFGAITTSLVYTYTAIRVTSSSSASQFAPAGNTGLSGERKQVHLVKNPTSETLSVVSAPRAINQTVGNPAPRLQVSSVPQISGQRVVSLDVTGVITATETQTATSAPRETLIPHGQGYSQIPPSGNIMPFRGSEYGIYWRWEPGATSTAVGLYKIVRDDKVATGYNTVTFPTSIDFGEALVGDATTITPSISMNATTIVCTEYTPTGGPYPGGGGYDDAVSKLRVLKRNGDTLELGPTQQEITGINRGFGLQNLIRCSPTTMQMSWFTIDSHFNTFIRGLGISGTSINTLSTSTIVDGNGSWGQTGVGFSPIPIHFGNNHSFLLEATGFLGGIGFFLRAFDYTPEGGVTHWYLANNPVGSNPPQVPEISAFGFAITRFIEGQNEFANIDVGFEAMTFAMRLFFGDTEVQSGDNSAWPRIDYPYSQPNEWGPVPLKYSGLPNPNWSYPAAAFGWNFTGFNYSQGGGNTYMATQPNPVLVINGMSFTGGQYLAAATGVAHCLVTQNDGVLTNVTPDPNNNFEPPYAGQVDWNSWATEAGAIPPQDVIDRYALYYPTLPLGPNQAGAGNVFRHYVSDSPGTEICISEGTLNWDDGTFYGEQTAYLVPFAFRVTGGVTPGITFTNWPGEGNETFLHQPYSYSFQYEITSDPSLPVTWSVLPPIGRFNFTTWTSGLPPGFSLSQTGLLTWDGHTTFIQGHTYAWTVMVTNGQATAYVMNSITISLV